MVQAVSPQTQSTIPTATIWQRTRATILDLIIISLIQGLINSTFGSERITNPVLDPSTSGGFSSYTSTIAVDGIWLWMAAFTYYLVLEGLFGQTVGKAAVGIRVTGLDGRPSTAWQLLIRNALRALDWLPSLYFLGALVARLSGGRQRIGDHIARTLVIPASAVVGTWPSAEQRRQRKWAVAALLVALLAVCGGFSYFGRPPIVLADLAAERQFPDGQFSDYRHGAAEWHGGSITYPVTFTRPAPSRACTGTITLDWHGFLESWRMSSAQSSC